MEAGPPPGTPYPENTWLYFLPTMFACLCRYMRMCVHVHVEAKVNLGCRHQLCHLSPWGQGPSLAQNSAIRVGWLASEVVLSLPPQHWDHKYTSHLFCVFCFFVFFKHRLWGLNSSLVHAFQTESSPAPVFLPTTTTVIILLPLAGIVWSLDFLSLLSSVLCLQNIRH